MDSVDILVLVVGCITIFEAARRFDLLSLARKQSDKITNRNETGSQENCISYDIYLNPRADARWKPGISAAINERPFIIFLIIILILGILLSTLSLVSSYPRMSILLIALAFSFAFHSAPDSLTTRERYLEIITFQDPGSLNGHDWRILSNAVKEYQSWPSVELIFGLLFATIWVWPEMFLFYVVVIILLVGFIFLGSKYSITKGIYGSN